MPLLMLPTYRPFFVHNKVAVSTIFSYSAEVVLLHKIHSINKDPIIGEKKLIKAIVNWVRAGVVANKSGANNRDAMIY